MTDDEKEEREEYEDALEFQMTEENDKVNDLTPEKDQKVEQEITNDALNTSIEDVRVMCNELLIKQNNLEKSNTENAEKQRSFEKKIEKLLKEQQEKLESIQLQLNGNEEKKINLLSKSANTDTEL